MCVQSSRKAALYFIKLLLRYEKIVLKTRARLFFSLLSYLCNMKQVCSKQAGGYFCNMKHVCSKQGGAYFLVDQLLISVILLKYFYYEFYNNFRE